MKMRRTYIYYKCRVCHIGKTKCQEDYNYYMNNEQTWIHQHCLIICDYQIF